MRWLQSGGILLRQRLLWHAQREQLTSVVPMATGVCCFAMAPSAMAMPAAGAGTARLSVVG